LIKPQRNGLVSISDLNLGIPEYDCNTSFFNVIMANIRLVDMCLAGAEGYDKVSFPLLVDALIAKCGPRREELSKQKKNMVDALEEQRLTKDQKNQQLTDINMEIYGETVTYLYKYLNFEQRVGVMRS
jgi:hypothetical protein